MDFKDSHNYSPNSDLPSLHACTWEYQVIAAPQCWPTVICFPDVSSHQSLKGRFSQEEGPHGTLDLCHPGLVTPPIPGLSYRDYNASTFTWSAVLILPIPNQHLPWLQNPWGSVAVCVFVIYLGLLIACMQSRKELWSRCRPIPSSYRRGYGHTVGSGIQVFSFLRERPPWDLCWPGSTRVLGWKRDGLKPWSK